MMQRAKRLAIFSVLAMLSVLVLASYTRAEVVVFADPALEYVIRERIDLPVGDIDEADLEVIDILQASGQGIVNISGISLCINLEVLDLSDNLITDISELADLQNLTVLNLDDSGLEDIAPVGDLTNLTSLSLAYNKFQGADLDVVLSNLGNLAYLNLSGNDLTDIGTITSLISLGRLFLADNRISDISGLKDCSNLSYLNLYKNNISDITVLAELEHLEFVDLTANPISDFSPVAGVCTVYRDKDADEDNILDTWEIEHFGSLSHDGTGDTDRDGLSDLREYQRGTNPNDPDTDGDGMPDGWEVNNRLDPLVDDALADADGDGLSNLQEYLSGTDPRSFTLNKDTQGIDQSMPGEADSDDSSDSTISNDGSSGNCFIATAAFGSPMERHVTVLKRFRDTCLLPYAPGRAFVSAYYEYSPPLADFISEHETLKAAVRISLMPLVAVSYTAIHLGAGFTLTMLAVIVILPMSLILPKKKALFQ